MSEGMYTKLEDSLLEVEPQGHAGARRRGSLCLSIGIFISISVALVLFTVTKLPHRDGNVQVTDCGHSVLEAKANHCSFDPTTIAWLPGKTK